MSYEWLSWFGDVSDVDQISYAEWVLANPWPSSVLFAGLLGAAAFSAWSYWRHRQQGTVYCTVMAILRTLGIVTILLMLFQPVLRLEYSSRSADRVLILVDKSQSMGIEDPRDKPEDRAYLDKVMPEGTAGNATRMALAQAALTNEEVGLLTTLAEDHELSMFSFGGETGALPDAEAETIKGIAADDAHTGLGSALGYLLERFSGQAVAGVVILSDLAWNSGSDPVGMAERLGHRSIPVFPVGIGLPNPPDLAIATVHVKDNVFAGDDVPLKVQIHSSLQFRARSVDLVVTMDDIEIERRRVSLIGGTQIEEAGFTAPDVPGDHTLKVAIDVLPEEVVVDNNYLVKPIRIIDEKIKVLFVEGMPRWEYRYLRWVLKRDKRLDVKFLMTQGDAELAKYSTEYLARFPEQGRSGWDFDLVIIGDVPASYFNGEQLEWMTEQVKRRGGALLMIAGPQHAPMSYQRSALADLLPVKVRGKEWIDVSAGTVPQPTEEGIVSGIADLHADIRTSVAVWKRVHPLRKLPPVVAKPSATVLVSLNESITDDPDPYPLLAWHRFGAGKVMFVGTEDLWRLRFKVGRRYHERLWAQAIQFLTLSRLLGGNDRVTIETDGQRYATGEQVQVFADVMNEFLEPIPDEEYTVKLVRDDGTEKDLRLSAVPGVPGFFQGFMVPRDPGAIMIKAPMADRESANEVQIVVEDLTVEMREPGMRWELAEQLAARSGGKAIRLDEIDSLAEQIKERTPVTIRRTDIELWDHWILYVILLVCAGAEWFARRRRRMV
ncbi:MAG: hypothetical protein PF961_04515 [Planctomycetota bacterium]|jgi:hypothetical protein|nr:hypothetical protein [Planctomycetota bacterium]